MKHVLRSRRVARFLRSKACGAGLLVLSGCQSVGPDYRVPEARVPEAWHAGAAGGLEPGAPEVEGWWRAFGDPLLDELVLRAARQSLDLREAMARVREARALRAAAAGERWPDLDAQGSFESRGESDNTPLGSFVPDTEILTAGFDAAWELDLWGRVRRSVEAAGAELEASVEDARDVAVLVAAEVARGYVELRALQRRVALAAENVALQEQTLELVSGRYEAGLVSEGDLTQARVNLETTRARLPALETARTAAEHRLAVLIGEPPGALSAELRDARPIPVPPLAVAVGVPADLLRRRPDVRRAERLLAAETARIGVAEAELYPELSLRGSLGLASDPASDLLESDSAFFGIGPTLRWNLFDGSRLRQGVVAQEARAEQALARWERTVLLALEEAENAMAGFAGEQARLRSLSEAVLQAGAAVELARTQYTEGLSDFQAVLVAERALADLEDELARSEATAATTFVALQKALGGGWTRGAVHVAAR
jgi:NodT family efflux transporter outer membrane factor (OMF) lipoprotein